MAASKVSSALDMTLDEVIKFKGNKRAGGRGPKKGGSGDQAGGRKPAAEAKAKEASKDETKATADNAGEKGDVKAGGRGIRRLRRVTAAQALGPAAKAAAAAAKATATTATGAVTGPDQAAARAAKAQEKAHAPAKQKAKAPAPSPSGGGAVKGTEQKLGMSLEDLVRFEVKKKAKAALANKPIKKLRSVTAKGKAKAKAKATAKGKAKAKAKAGTKRKAGQESWGPGWGTGGGRDLWMGNSWAGSQSQESWRRGNDFVTWESRKRPGGGGMYADWSLGTKRKADSWGTPEKRMRAADGPRSSAGWGRASDEYGWGGGQGSWGESALALSGVGSYRTGSSSASDRGSGGTWARTLARAWGSGSDWGSAPKREVRRVGASGDFDAAPRGSSERSYRIRVSNVPKNLDWRDIKEAFEDNGRVTRCEVERGVAYVTFSSAADAKKAVQTFDRGELNGQTIYVTHE